MAPPPSTSSRLSRQLPTTLPIARSVRPRSAATNEVISSGIEVPAETIVRPITASLTPSCNAAALAPLTRSWAPKPSTTIPPNSRIEALTQPSSAVSASISGSAFSISSGSSRAVRIRPVEAMPQTAADTARSRGTSRRTNRLSTFRGSTRALLPSTTITLKMLLPTALLTARASEP